MSAIERAPAMVGSSSAGTGRQTGGVVRVVGYIKADDHWTQITLPIPALPPKVTTAVQKQYSTVLDTLEKLRSYRGGGSCLSSRD